MFSHVENRRKTAADLSSSGKISIRPKKGSIAKSGRIRTGSSQRTRLTVSQKMEIIKEIKRHVPYPCISEKYSIGLRTIARIKKEEQSILKAYGSCKSEKKVIPKSLHEKLDSRVLKVLESIHKSKNAYKHIGYSGVRKKASHRDLRDGNSISSSERELYLRFKSSKMGLAFL